MSFYHILLQSSYLFLYCIEQLTTPYHFNHELDIRGKDTISVQVGDLFPNGPVGFKGSITGFHVRKKVEGLSGTKKFNRKNMF